MRKGRGKREERREPLDFGRVLLPDALLMVLEMSHQEREAEPLQVAR